MQGVAVGIRDALTVTQATAVSELAEVVTQELIETLNDQAVRREVFDEAMEHLDVFSMMELHTVIDALVKVLKGTNHDD